MILPVFTVTLYFLTIYGDRYIDWFETRCPDGYGDSSCVYTNNNKVDVAVSLFFQVEDDNGASFRCISDLREETILPSNVDAFNCPKGMVYEQNLNNHSYSYCLLEDLTFPSDLSKVEPYCEYLDDGYEGFTFLKTDFPNYQCPPSMRQGENNEGTVFCTYDLPASTVANLPPGTQSYCTLEAFQHSELGFRYINGSTPTPTSDVNGIVYCSRAWMGDQSYSGGDCYFIVPAGESYSCQGQGNTLMIGAHGTKLAGSNYEQSATNIKKSLSLYKNNNTRYDEWIYLEIESASGGLNEFSCTYMTNNKVQVKLCNFTADSEKNSIYSCNFMLPANKTMKCSSSTGINVLSAYSRRMTNPSMLTNGEPINLYCPNVTYPESTMCDCTIVNPSNKNDLLVTFEASNEDDQFNAFHGGFYGVNTCSWGANNGNKNDGGGCYFILPAGSEFDLFMQWGSTSIISSTSMFLDGTIYPPPQNDNDKDKNVKNNDYKGVKLAISRPLNEMIVLWTKWKTRYNKIYSSNEEEMKRFNNFQQFVSLIDNNHNKIGKKINDIKNKNADLSIEEFNDIYRGCSVPIEDFYDHNENKWKVPSNINISAIPTSFDWRTKGAVTPIKDQGQCGSCWSFSTTGVLESAWFIKTGELQSLSEEDLVECEQDCYACNGGWPYLAIQYVAKNGIDTEKSYPYTSGDGSWGPCQQPYHTKADISGHVKNYSFVDSTEDAMAIYVANYGPISVSLDAMTQLWWPYTDQSGIMTGCCNKDVDHAVLIVGYGVNKTSSMQYWIIKNSWGTDWGYDGYIYLERGTNQCGITYSPVVPILQ